MKVTLTGAAGNLGSVVCRHLVAAGFDVIATDRAYRSDLPVRVRVLDLLNAEGIYDLLEGAEALVHLGNHPSFHGREGQRIFGENATMNFNVLEAARQCGVRKVVFASTIQVIGGRRYAGEDDPGSSLPYLPLDGEVPPNPGNPYALSKAVSEQILAYFAKFWGMSCTALRFPLLISPQWMDRFKSEPRQQPWPGSNLDEAFACLTMTDAAALIEAILRAPLEGFRIYFPVCPDPAIRLPIPQIIRTYFPNVPLRKPIEQIDAMVDVSRITRETGWAPSRLY